MIVLETDRLYLRPYDSSDLSDLYEMLSDPETMKYYPSALNRRQTKEWIKRNQDRYKRDGFGLWVVCLKDTERMIGDCGLIKQTVEGETEVEIGYHIHKRFWSNGYASEAAAACREYGFRQLGLSKLVSIIAPDNKASIRVAQKIGFTKEMETYIFGRYHHVYSLTREERERTLRERMPRSDAVNL